MKVKLLNDNVLKTGDKKGDVVVVDAKRAEHLIKVGAVEEVKEKPKKPQGKKE